MASWRFYAVVFKSTRQVFKTKKKCNNACQNQSHIKKGFNSPRELLAWFGDRTLYTGQPTYYAVRVGRQPGIYRSQKEFLAQVEGFSRGEGYRFYTEQGARDYLDGTEPALTYQPRPLPPGAPGAGKKAKKKKASTKKSAKKKKQPLSARLKNLFVAARQRLIRRPLNWLYNYYWHMTGREVESRIVSCKIIGEHPLTIYTDGSCSGHAQGYAAIIVDSVSGTEVHVGTSSTAPDGSTSAEIRAIIRALEMVDIAAPLHICTDSMGAKNMIEQLASAAGHERVYARCKYPEQKRLFEDLAIALAGRAVTVEWVPGHKGVYYNELCDKLARASMREAGK